LTQIKAAAAASPYASPGIGDPASTACNMHREFTIRPLTGALVEKSYPFAAALNVRDLASWRRFVEGYTGTGSPDSGVIGADTRHGYLAGVLFYRVDRRNQDGAALVCDPFVVADLPRYAAPVRALLAAADRIAADRGCKWVRVVLPATGDPLNAEPLGCEGALFRAGFALESLSFRRRRVPPVHRASLPAQAQATMK
jgi:hypothetical protein